MKTAVSIPDGLYLEAEKVAKSLRIPRSQLFAKAIREYIDSHKTTNVTERLNEVYSKLGDERPSDVNIEAIRKLTKDDAW